jgi:general secretion pathway protein D
MRDSLKTSSSHTSTTMTSDGGYRFDFQDADIKAVITALAAAGNLNVAYGDLPPKKVSLRLNHSVQASEIPSILRNVALTNGLKVSEDQGLITVSTIAPPVPNRRAGPSLDGTQLYVYRLKHADASTLATLLQGIFTTSTGGAATPRFNGGVGGTGANGTNNQRGRNRTTGAANGTGGLGGGGLGGNGGGGTLGGGGFGGGGFGGGGFGGGGFGGGGFGGGTFGQGQNGRGGGFTFQLPFSLTGSNDEAIIIAPDETTNSLLVRATPDDWSVIKEAIEAVDLRPLQVVIEVMIAEVQRDDDLTFGVSGSASNARTSTNGTVAGGTLGPAPDSSDNFVLNLSRRGAVDVNVAIRALQTRGNVKILSLPLVFAQNNKESALIVGTEQPFVQSYQTGLTAEGVQNQVVQYREVGTMLDIVPTINPDGYVNLDVYQEVSSATNQVQFGAPVISTRQASASVFVKNGQTIVVGGLTDRQQQDTRQGIPLLSAIPWLGALFGTTTHTAQRTELYLFLTPHIVESDMDAEHIRQEIGKNSKLMEKLPVDSVRVIDPEGNDPHPQGPPATPPSDSSTTQQAAPPPRMRMYPGRPRQQQ